MRRLVDLVWWWEGCVGPQHEAGGQRAGRRRGTQRTHGDGGERLGRINLRCDVCRRVFGWGGGFWCKASAEQKRRGRSGKAPGDAPPRAASPPPRARAPFTLTMAEPPRADPPRPPHSRRVTPLKTKRSLRPFASAHSPCGGGGRAREIAGSVRAAPAGGGAMWARAATRERRGGGGRARLDAGADAADEDAGPAGGGLGLDGHLGGHADGSEKGFRVSGVPRGQSRPPWEARTAGGAVAAGRGGVLRASHWTTGRTSSQKNCGGHGGSGRGGPGRERRPIAQRRAVRCAAGTETTARPSGGVWQYRERAS